MPVIGYDFTCTVLNDHDEPQQKTCELRGSKAQVIKEIRSRIPLAGEVVYELSKKGFAEFFDGVNTVQLRLDEVRES